MHLKFRRIRLLALLSAIAVLFTVTFYVDRAVPQDIDGTQVLSIASIDPPDGSTLVAGDVVELSITTLEGADVGRIAILCEHCTPTETDGGVPQRGQLTIPVDGTKRLEVTLLPVSTVGVPLLGTQVTYSVQRPPSPIETILLKTSLAQGTTSGSLDLEVGLDERLWVYGQFSGGRIVDVSGAPETAYSIVPTGIVELVSPSPDPAGASVVLLRGLDYGVTQLEVTNSGVVANLVVRVGFSEIRGDLNADRQLDAADEKIIRDALGRPANPEDPRDLNGNGVIDKGDIDVLKSLSCGSAPEKSLVMGGGSSKTDCFGEFSLAGDPLLDARKCIPKTKQICTDGAPCDLDGVQDGACTFNTRVILNHQDPRLPECTSAGIASFDLLKPSEKDAARNTDDAENRMGLLDALAGLGALPVIGSTHSAAVDLRVPLKPSRRAPKKGTRTFRLRVVSDDGRNDTDTLVLQCLPPALAGPSPTPQPTMTPSPVQTDTGFLLGSNQAGGWTDGQNLFADDDQDAVGMKVGSLRPTHQISGFGFSLPSDATVTGIEVQIEGNIGAGNYFDDIFTDLSFDGGSSFIPVYSVTDAGECASSTPGIAACRGSGLPGGRGTWALGGPTDTWGRSWTPGELSDPKFRVRIWCWARGTTPTNTCRADYVQARVFYSAPPPPTPTPSPTPVATATLAASWTNKAPLPVAAQILGANAIGSDSAMYMVGMPADCQMVLRYSPGANSWSERTRSPACVIFGGAAAVGQSVFVVSAHPATPATHSLQVYDTAQNSWSVGPPWPTPLLGPATAVVGTNTYFIGGEAVSGTPASNVSVFDTSGSSWSTLPSLSTNRSYAAAVNVGTMIYVFGGFDSAAGGALNSVEAYDTANPGLGWVARASMPTARYRAVAGVINGRVYIVGGRSGSSRLTTVERYDPPTDSWTGATGTGTAHDHGGGGVIGGLFYIAGGFTASDLTNVTEEGALP